MAIWSQIINAMLLPVVLISMMYMVNSRYIVGDYVNNRLQNVIGIGTTAVLLLLTAALLLSPMLPFFVRIYHYFVA
ncbi:MAG: hypothetical protein V2A70_10390 [Candidatus Omnitrophota bacterium]